MSGQVHDEASPIAGVRMAGESAIRFTICVVQVTAGDLVVVREGDVDAQGLVVIAPEHMLEFQAPTPTAEVVTVVTHGAPGPGLWLRQTASGVALLDELQLSTEVLRAHGIDPRISPTESGPS